MKKVVLMTGVLAAGLAAAPVTANAAAPSSPKLSETNEVKAQDPVDVYNRYAALIVARRAEVDGNRQSIINNLAPFTKDEMKFTDKVTTETYDWENKKWVSGEYVYGLDYQGFPLEFAGEEYNPANGDWHPKAKAEALDILSDFEHELHNMELALNELWNKYDVLDEIKEDEFYEKLKAPYMASGADFAVTIAKIMSPDYSQNILPERLKKLNKDWNIFTEYQLLGEEKWAQYFYLTQQQEYKEVNETYDVINTYKVQTKSNDFRTFLEKKHNNRKNHIGEDNRTFCDGDCCEDSKNLDKIKELYDAFCAEHKAELNLVLKYQADRKSLLDGEKGLSAVYETYRADFDPTTIQSTADPKNPGYDSYEATTQIKAQKTKIENAKEATENFIRTFNAVGKTFAQWDGVVPKWDGEGKNFTRGSETKHLDNTNYNAEAKQQIADLKQLIADYDALIAAAEKNRDNYDKLYKDILDTDDWNAQDKSHDADKFAATNVQNEHNNVKYYKSEAFDAEVPAARQAALNAAEQAYEQFKLKTDAEVTTFKTGNTSAVDTSYEKYKDIVDRANKNEKAHDAQHKTLDPLKETYQALLDEYAKLVDGLLVNDNADHKNITAADVKELYPNNADHEYAKAIEKAKKNADAVKADLVNAYNDATSKTEEYYDLGTAYVEANDAELRGYYKTLETKNGDFREAIDKAIDNEVAFLEGAHAYDAALAQAHHDLDEYAHHPETFGHWNTEIDAVLAKFPPVLAELIKKYDVEADARNYVKNVLPGVLQGLAKDVADLEKTIKDNQTARDANEAAINAALTDLAALKAKYDTTKFTLEDKVTTGEATALKADFQNAWKSYVENDLDVPAPNTESDLHFAQTAVGVDFDADIQAMLSAIKSENSIDFDIHHQATNDYALNLAAVKYLKDKVIPALNDTFDALVQANEEAHKAQYEAYTALLKETYECAKIAGTAIDGISVPGDKHSKAEGVVKGDLEELKAQIDNSYIAGSAVADNDKVAKLNNKYVKDLAYAKANDETFKAAYDKYVTENGKVAKVNGKVVENWKNGYQYENTTSEGKNMYSDTANTNVTSAYTNMSAVEKKYLEDIKKYWVNNVPVWEADAVAPNEAAPYAGTALSDYTDKVTKYNTQVQRATNNDAYFEELITELGKKITLTKQEEYVGATGTLANLFSRLNGYKVKGNEGVYDNLLKEIVANWEGENLIWNGLNSTEMQKIKAYKQNAENYNALVEKVNALVSDQKALDERKELISKLEIITTQLSTDDKTQWDEQRGDYAKKTGILGKEHELQDRIDALATAIDNEYHNGTASNWKVTAEKINTDIFNYLYWPAVEENNKFLANENAFKGTETNRYQDIKNAIATYNDTSKMTPVVAEAYLKGVADKLTKLETLKNTLETEYLAENAVKYAPEFDAKLNDLLKGVGEGADHNFGLEESKTAAEEIGENLGDVNNKYKGVDEWDITNTKDNPGLVEVYLYNLCGMDNENYKDYKNGDLDFNGEIDPNDITLLNNLLWYKSVWGKEGRPKAPATDVEFEGSVDLVVAGNTVALALNNNVAVNSMSFDVKVPAGAKFSSVIGTARTEGLQVMSAQIAADTYRVLVVSLGVNKVINGNEGNLVSFNVAGEGEVEVFNVRAANGLSHKLNGAAVSLGQTTGIDEVASEGNSDIFGLDGIRQSVMKAGVNIVRGANGAVKKIFK